ncbi:hypothetical protein ASD98_05850 [Flavobacterium sp. Root186]|nr:hypothetical protein ASD98_05850 [Flavobacterium sp. Root186]
MRFKVAKEQSSKGFILLSFERNFELCPSEPLILYFKSISDFIVLKLNDTELLIFAAEMFFFRCKGPEGQRFLFRLKAAKVQSNKDLYILFF